MSKITKTSLGFSVPDQVDIPFIDGDAIGPEIATVARAVSDEAIKLAYKGKRSISWIPVLAGGVAYEKTGSYLPEETISCIKEHLVAVKGPLTTPVGKGIRSVNVLLRQVFDLFACIRPIEWFSGVPSPVKHPERVNMVIFRENIEDCYAGIEWNFDDPLCVKLREFLSTELGAKNFRFPSTTSIGIKPISKEGTERIVKASIDYALEKNRSKVTLVHKGNIQKFTEGGFQRWGYDYIYDNYAERAFTMKAYLDIKQRLGDDEAERSLKEAKNQGKIIVDDCLADAFLQNSLLYPERYDVITTMNINGDYISDALAAQVGGIGISPGANINSDTGCGIFEATHGTAPDLAGKNMANPSAVLLSVVLLLEYMGWDEAAMLIKKGLGKSIENKEVTKDLAFEGVTGLSTSAFGQAIIKNF